jgi:hypothetical protein
MPRNVGKVSKELQRDSVNKESYSTSIKPSISPRYANKATKALANSVRNHNLLITSQTFYGSRSKNGPYNKKLSQVLDNNHHPRPLSVSQAHNSVATIINNPAALICTELVSDQVPFVYSD